MTAADRLQSSETCIQVTVLFVTAITPKSIRHGYKLYNKKIVQVKKSLLCPDWIGCSWCKSVVERARSLATPDRDIFY